MAVWPWSTLPGQSACAGSSEKRIWPDCQGTNGPRSLWFPETRGTAGLIPGIGQYWPANHRSGDQPRSAPPSWSGTLGSSGTLLMCPAKSKGSDHVDAFSDCLVNIHDGQRGCLRGRHRPGSDDSSTRGLRVRNDPGRRCSELFGQRAGGLVHRSHAAVAISEGSFSLEPFPFRLNRNGALDSLFDAFSLREPVSTSLENALVIPDRIRRGHAELPSRAIVGPAIVTP